jgi:hypothetical protein
LRQYLYFGTSKASKASSKSEEHLRQRARLAARAVQARMQLRAQRRHVPLARRTRTRTRTRTSTRVLQLRLRVLLLLRVLHPARQLLQPLRERARHRVAALSASPPAGAAQFTTACVLLSLLLTQCIRGVAALSAFPSTDIFFWKKK